MPPKKGSKRVPEPEPEPEPESESSEEEVDEEEEEFDEEDESEEEDGDESDEEEDEEEEDDEDDDDEDDVDEEAVSEQGEEDRNDHEDVVDDLNYDLFNLTASHYHPLVWKKDSKKEEVLLEETQRAAQYLYNKLRALPTEMSETGPVTILPSEVLSLPRFKKIPEPKPETKWEKFAREKGIKKSKKDRMLYDEVTGEFAPRFGYKRTKNGLQEQAIVEIKPGDDPYADPWAEDRKQKKARVDKNEKQQQKNQMRAVKAKGKGSGVTAYSPEAVPGIPLELTGKQAKRGKGGVKNALKLAQLSTASMGRFDDYRTGEPERKLAGNKRKFRDNFGTLNSEKDSMKAQIRFVDDKKTKREKGVTNSLAAYDGILPDAPSFSFKKSKGKGKGTGGADKKRRK